MKKFYKSEQKEYTYKHREVFNGAHYWLNLKDYAIDIWEERMNYRQEDRKIMLSFIFLFKQVNK